MGLLKDTQLGYSRAQACSRSAWQGQTFLSLGHKSSQHTDADTFANAAGGQPPAACPLPGAEHFSVLLSSLPHIPSELEVNKLITDEQGIRLQRF